MSYPPSADSTSLVTLAHIQEAAQALQPVVKRTPLDHSKSCSVRVGSELYLKCEHLQTTGSFKIRGAMNKIRSLSKEERARGVIASSAGNHAQGVAFAGTHYGVETHIVMPVTAPVVKVMATKGYGADVIQRGNIYDEAYQAACELAREKSYTFVHPFEDAKVIAGQGTLGLEICEDLKDVDCIVVPIGGGGLISGIATAVKAINPKCRILGVQTQASPSMVESYRKKTLVQMESSAVTIADGVAVKQASEFMLKNYLLRLVDDVATVTEDEISDAIVFLMERAKSVVEGSGAIALAAALSGKFPLGRKTVVILSGGNIDLNIISKIIDRGMKKNGRLARIVVAVEDRPGALLKLANVIAQKRANIMQVYHDRSTEGLLIGETAIEVLLESSGFEHLNEIRKSLTEVGGRLLT